MIIWLTGWSLNEVEGLNGITAFSTLEKAVDFLNTCPYFEGNVSSTIQAHKNCRLFIQKLYRDDVVVYHKILRVLVDG